MRARRLRIACLVALGCAGPSSTARADDADRACLDALGAAKVAFDDAPPTKGVRTPILVRGALGSITLRARDGRPGEAPLMDCGLARALLDVAPIFDAAGIRTLIYSGAYAYRARRGGTKLSEHAHGLAIDVHAFVARDGTLYDVRRDFEPGAGVWTTVAELPDCVGHPGTPAGRVLRTLACRLRAGSTLREVITPDDNSDHADHFHLEAFPDAATRARGLLSPRIPVIDD
ncbi:MAG TPA: extensin family protein [Polyangia bacterium]|nr:extensin family protein [Polyangia bacterium]